MSFVAAVATGPEAVAGLERLLAPHRPGGNIGWVFHEDRAVFWNAHHRWVSSAHDGDVTVVLDGQLHNLFQQDRSQAELLLERYRDLGSDVARGLLGDFVLIVLDRSRRRLIVARDPVGVRPWYQATAGERQAGASDVATLCRLPWVDDGPDESEALAYLADGVESRGATFHRGIGSLRPGSTWCSDPWATDTRVHHRWDIRPQGELGWDDAVNLCRTVIDEAVRSRVRVAGMATSQLSGGLDSSAVVGTAKKLGFQDVLVGRLLFDGEPADEREFSDSVIDHWGLRAVSARPWVLSDHEMHDLMHSLHRPPPDPNFTMFAPLHRAFLAEGRWTGLTGLGGDDAFVARSRRSRVVSSAQLGQFAELAQAVRADVRNPRLGWRRTWKPVLGYLLPRTRRKPPAYISRRAADGTGLTERFSEPVPRLTGIKAIDERARGLTVGYVAWLLEAGAVVSDLSGWRDSHPFFDPRVINAIYGLNPWFPVRGGHDRALEVAAFADRLPDEIRTRRSKAEFSGLPWPGEPHDSSTLMNGPLGQRGWLDREGLNDLMSKRRMGHPEAVYPLFRATALDRWFRLREA